MKIETKLILRRVLIDFDASNDVRFNFHGTLNPLNKAGENAPEFMVQTTVKKDNPLAEALFQLIEIELQNSVQSESDHAERMADKRKEVKET